MRRYIDADKVMEEINRIGGHNLCEWETIGVKALIDRQPTADVVEVRHGYWKCDYDSAYGETRVTCSVCGDYRYIKGCFVSIDDEPIYREDFYCPHCGAKMDGERSENGK